jgi:hypothetical protein
MKRDLEDTLTSKSEKPKRDTRAEIARATKVPERKLRAAPQIA